MDISWALEAAYNAYRGKSGTGIVDFGADGHDLIFDDGGRIPVVIQKQQGNGWTYLYDLTTIGGRTIEISPAQF